MTEKQSSKWRSDKWLAAVIWLVSLAAVVATSIYGVTTVLAGGAFSGILAACRRDDFSAGRIGSKLIPCLSDSSEMIAGSEKDGS
jgi:hypothetical protein